jgi:dipeptidyl aminopeptidase/acylaminoacyl peptidase
MSDARNRQGDGGAFYQYCRQHGAWPEAVTGWNPHRETEKFFPYMPVQNVDQDCPPTVLVHGTADTDVPYEQSTMMARALKAHDIEHELIPIEGGEHGLTGGDRDDIDAAYQRAFAFLKVHLENKRR